jgi:hypothetical protein
MSVLSVRKNRVPLRSIDEALQLNTIPVAGKIRNACRCCAATEVSVPFQFQWTELITPGEWRSIASILNLSDGQERFLWHALHDPREQAIARHMALTAHGAHSHRMAVFKKLKVDSMPGAIRTRVCRLRPGPARSTGAGGR